jgi:hypothetical protein
MTPVKGHEQFPATNWQAVRDAGQPGTSRRSDALDALLRQYLPVLKEYLISRFRLTAHEADDFLQNFVINKVLNGELLSRADHARGHFRILLVTSLARYVISEFRKANAQKRSPNHAAEPLDDLCAKQFALLSEDPKRELDVAFAQAVFAEAVRRMKIECGSGERKDLWGVFDARFLQPLQKGVDPLDNEVLMRRYGFKTAAQASNALTTAKRMFARNFRAVVAEYVREEGAIDGEIRELKNILAQF